MLIEYTAKYFIKIVSHQVQAFLENYHITFSLKKSNFDFLSV